MSIPRFLIFFTIIALVLMGAAWLISTYWITEADLGFMIAAILVSFITGGLAYIITYQGLDKSTRQFSAMLVLGMFSKLLIGLIGVLVVAVEFKPMLKSYVATYMLTYFVFTAFEVYGLMRKLRA
ncbi:MAG: hypothetical protein AAF927_18020 [Bacteroidota bacterium]